MSQFDEPLELPLSRKPDASNVSPDLVRRQTSFKAAFVLACQVSGLEAKEIYKPLKIDAGQWSRIANGDAHFPLDKIAEFCESVGNTVLPEWIAFQVGCGLVLLKTEAERRAELAEQALADERTANRLLKEIIATMGTGKA